MGKKVTKTTLRKIDAMVDLYRENLPPFSRFASAAYRLLSEHELLKPYLHSAKYRVKEPNHLRDKLAKKAQEAIDDGSVFDINTDNLFDRITDLAGVRLLHLHSDQFQGIHDALIEIFTEQQYVLVENVANTWDSEFEKIFSRLSIDTKVREDMYTSVHYIVRANVASRTPCEIQVRTLYEEVWGEVSHKVDYPERSKSVACQEQIRVLARVTSSGTRLVDSIFKSREEFQRLSSPPGTKKKSKAKKT